MGEFTNKVFQVVRQIPRGKVSTYGQVARLMGSPRSARYVGFALRRNPDPTALADGNATSDIPCHRVLFSDGRLCDGFAFGGPDVQRNLLESEGVTFRDNDHVDLKEHLWDGKAFCLDDADKPLAPPDHFDWAAELGED